MKNNLVETIKTILAESDAKDSLTIEKIREAIKNSEKPDFSSMKSGERFIYRDREWIFLGMEQGGALCITSDLYGKFSFDKDCCNDWRKSSLRKELLKNFLPTLDEADLLPYEMDLTADNGDTSYGKCTDKVGILSCDLYRKYRKVVPLFKEWMWTCTPWACSPTNAHHVRYVNSDGTLNDYHAYDAYGCVPACIFTIDNH